MENFKWEIEKGQEMGKQKETPEIDDIAKDWALIGQIHNHIHVYGFASVLDNLVIACDDKVSRWEERLKKAKKLRKTLGDVYGRN